VCIQEDVTESRKINERLSFQASHDALTGLYNRHEFERRLALAVRTAQEQGAEHTLCFLDLDQFKVVNDTSGHGAGDELLQQFAKLLQGQLRRGDSLARFGGDEFAILMENCPVPRAHAKAEVLRQMAEEFRFAWEDKTFRIGISVGLASVNSGSGNASDALRHADTACYMAKDAGRNRIRVYRADDDDLQGRGGDMHWLSRINHALENTGFVLFVQAVVRSDAEQAASAYEVLLRMRDADGGLALPGAFLPAAERYNLATRIDRWVIATLFDWIKLHQAELAPDTTFAVNLSGQSLGDTDLLGYLVDRFESGLVPGGRIKFEVTETAAIANLATAKTYIATLKAYGVEFALDDFGSGLSSFAYLKNLDVDYLKIDGMFVRDILNDPLDAAMVRSINDIGHVMGMQTIAEFVENEGILKEVGDMGVDFAQGYGVGRPRPIETLLARVEREAV
jgi:diguanylate cyclase (GGDEF)-like protein